MRHPRARAASPRPRPRRASARRGRSAASAHVALLGAVGALLVGSPAAAHDALVGTEPADGAVLDAPPAQVVLTFSAAQAGVGTEVLVTGPDAAVWSDGPADVQGAVVTQPLAPGMPDGDYAVAWRSVAGDGHPVSGELTFTVATPQAPTATTTPAASAAVDPTDPAEPAEPTAPPAVAAPAESAPVGTPVAVAPVDAGGVPWVAVAGGGGLLVAVGVLAAVRRRRGAGRPGTAGGSS